MNKSLSKKGMVKRVALSKVKRQSLQSPRLFLLPSRIDIAAKTILARSYVEGNTSSWPEYIYKEHIRAFNNFYEDEPRKNKYSDFYDSFIKTIEGVKNDNSWKPKEPVLRESNSQYLINGAHRVAASIVLGDKINTKSGKKTWSGNYNYEFFRSGHGNIPAIDENVLDYITIEYVSLKTSNIFVAIIFPTADGHRDEAFKRLSSLGEIVNMKSFRYNEFIGKEVIKQLYFNSRNDEWNYGLDFESATYKADLCFAGKGDLQIYVIEANLDETTRVKEKQYLRNLWGKDKHSIHITDTIEEANRVVRMFFNQNSRNFMKINRTQEFASQHMYELFNKYISLAPKSFIERDNIAIEGSAVLDLHGIRKGRDLDYISRKPEINFTSDGIERHSEEENLYHDISLDELLTNPQNFFYYKGCKFLTLEVLRNYKKNRFRDTKDKKDGQDIKMIDAFVGDFSDCDSNVDYPLVSVIVPVYNTPKKYLSPALDSISSQVYPNMEIIIVDDGSNENVAKFLDNYVKNQNNPHQNWRLIHQKNMGLSGARNTGYRHSKGEYIQFLDADDYFDERLISSAVHRAKQTNADIVIENFTIKDYSSGNETILLDYGFMSNLNVFRLDDITDGKIGKIPYNVWSKLFKKDFLDANSILHDEELHRCEDVVFSYTALVNTDRITFLKFPYIVYRENLPQSNTNTNDKYPTDSVVSWNKLYTYLRKKRLYNQYKDDFLNATTGSLIWHMERMNTESGVKKLANEIVSFLKKIGCPETNIVFRYAKLALDDHITYKEMNSMNRLLHSKEREINQLQNDIAIQRDSINNLNQPGVRIASRKLLGSIKRKLKRDMRNIVK